MEQPPDWFWSVIEQAKPSLGRLATWLEAASEEEVVQFALAYDLAAEQLADSWDGPHVDDVPYSEDDTEDLCDWVVSQGRGLWRAAMAREIDLRELARLELASERGETSECPGWAADVSNPAYDGSLAPRYLAHAVYRNRFGHSLRAVLEKMKQ